MPDFAYMMGNCDDQMISCEDFHFTCMNNIVYVADSAEGESYTMTTGEIIDALAALMVEDGTEGEYAYQLAVNIVANATGIGLAEFVRRYCEV